LAACHDRKQQSVIVRKMLAAKGVALPDRRTSG
jgi:hypothetical protein